MDSFELNKILGAILGTLLFVMGLGFVAEAIYAPHGSGPGYALPGAADVATPTGPATPVVVADIGTLLAKADPKAGAADAKKCQACHDFSEGGPNKIGPNLYGVVGRPIASHPGFAYSADIQKLAPGTWTYEKLNAWLTSPKAMAAGTKMTYAGDKDDEDRADIIAYLSTLSATPVPFPPPAPASSAEPASSAAQASSAAPAAAPSSAAPMSSSEAPASSSEAASSMMSSAAQ